MFFSKKSTAVRLDNPETEQGLSRSASPCHPVMPSTTPLIAPLAASSRSSKRGSFDRWQRSSGTTSMSPTCAPSPSVDTLVSELLRKNATLQDELDEVKEVSNLNQSTLQIVAKDLESKDQECAELRHSVHTLKADLELSKKGRGGELAVLQAQLHDITVSREALVLERDHHNKQMASLRQENDILANRATIAEDAVSRYMTYVNILKQQYQTLSSFFTGGQQTPKQPFYAEEMQ